MQKIYFTFLLGLLMSVFPVYTQVSEPDKKIDDIISKMTLDEKIDFIGGVDRFNIRAVPSLGVPLVRMADGPVGVRNYGRSTAYPASITLAASWDTVIANRVGNAIGKEARAKNVNIMLGPGMNIYRAPMNGRNFEYLGEDPFLAGKIASNYIVGMQKEGVMACAKHYIANFMEYDRHHTSSDMDPRTMYEIYLPAFKACVKNGNVATVMTSYNLVNGVHSSQNDLLINQILKKEWGFKGFVMSDWTSTYDGVACANAGLDLEMPDGVHMAKDTLIPAIKDGRISVMTIDDKIRRILKDYVRFDLFNHPDISAGYVLDSISVRQTAIDAARGGIVLLKNENNVLPFNKSKVKTIAVIGPNAYPAVTGGGGSSFVQPLHSLSLREAIEQAGGPDVKVNYISGVYTQGLMPVEFFDQTDFYTIVNGKKVPGMNCEVFSNRRAEGNPTYQFVMPKVNHAFADSMPGVSRTTFSAKISGFLKVDKPGKYRFVVSSDAGYRLMINDKQLVGSWRAGGETVRSVEYPLEAGKEYKIELIYVQRNPKAVIRLGYETPENYEKKMAEVLKNAVDVASKSDVVVLSVGFNSETEHEGDDRTFKLSDEQEKLIAQVIGAKKDVIIVMNAGGNVDMSAWIDKIKGLVYAWYPGGEGNKAVAEILFGITNPSGKLPVSFEKRWEDNATYNSYYDPDGDKHVKFTEGIFIGYRHFDKDNVEPQFPFGFGLSYTTFDFSNLTVSKDKFSSSEGVEVKMTVRNSGKMDGAEIVQLYVGEENPKLPRPVKELKSFAKVWLKAGESKQVSFKLNKDAFQYYNPDKKDWVVDNNNFNILIGSSSKDIRLKKTVAVTE